MNLFYVVYVQIRRNKAVEALDRAIASFRNRDKALDPADWQTISIDEFLRF